MKPAKTANRRQIALIALAGVLAVLFALDRFVLSPSDTVPAAPREPLAIPATSAPAGEAAPEPYLAGFNAYSEAVERPVFSLSRRPAPAPRVASAPPPAAERAPAPEPVPVPPPDIEVLGIAVDRDGTASALVRISGQTRRVYLGEEIEGWHVARIESDGLTLDRDSEGWRFPVVPVQ